MSIGTVTIDQMRGKLLTLDETRERLAATEPLDIYKITVSNAIRFTVEPGWNHGLAAKGDDDTVKATLQLGKGSTGVTLPLTKHALFSLGRKCGLTNSYIMRLPGRLLEEQLNFWYRGGFNDVPRFDRNLAFAAIKGRFEGLVPYRYDTTSNLDLLDTVLGALRNRFGDDVLVDYKFFHTPAKTRLRLVLPGAARNITGTHVEQDTWSLGMQLNNSLLGQETPMLEGYLFRWWCTNGAIETRARVGYDAVAAQRNPNQFRYDRLPLSFYAEQVERFLTELAPALDTVQSMTEHVIAEQDLPDVLRDLFSRYSVTVKVRPGIIQQLTEQPPPVTMYDVMQAITQAANSVQQTGSIEELLRIGGEIPHTVDHRCGSCHQMVTRPRSTASKSLRREVARS